MSEQEKEMPGTGMPQSSSASSTFETIGLRQNTVSEPIKGMSAAYTPQSPITNTTTGASHRPRPRHVPGYPGLAHVVGQNPGYSIFRRFTTLDTKILLYLQAELMQLEHQLSDLEVENSETSENGDNIGLQASVARLMNAEEGTSGWKQWQLIHEILKKKKQYS